MERTAIEQIMTERGCGQDEATEVYNRTAEWLTLLNELDPEDVQVMLWLTRKLAQVDDATPVVRSYVDRLHKAGTFAEREEAVDAIHALYRNAMAQVA